MFIAKCFTTIGAIFFIVLGLAILALTIFLFFNNSIFLGNTNVEYTILGIMFGVGVSVIGTAAQGVYGICKQKPKVVCAFQVLVIVFIVIFLGLGTSLFFLNDIFFNGQCNNSSNVVINYANNIYNVSNAIFCKQACACALDNTTASFNTTYTPAQKAYINSNYNLSQTGANNSQNCIKANLTDPEITILGAIGDLESLLQCSLWCVNSDPNSNLIYRFADVNSGKPLYFCYDELQNLFNRYSLIGKYICFGAGGIMTLLFLCNIYVCCSKEKQGRNKRERFMYYDDEESGSDRYKRQENKRNRNRDYR